MPAFAIRTTKSPEVERWLLGVRERLEHNQMVRLYFRGQIRSLGEGLYAMSLELLIPRLYLNVVALVLVALASLAWLFGWVGVSLAAYALGLALGLAWNLCFSPWFYRLVMRVSARKVTGRWVSVKDATAELLEKVAYGTV